MQIKWCSPKHIQLTKIRIELSNMMPNNVLLFHVLEHACCRPVSVYILGRARGTQTEAVRVNDVCINNPLAKTIFGKYFVSSSFTLSASASASSSQCHWHRSHPFPSSKFCRRCCRHQCYVPQRIHFPFFTCDIFDGAVGIRFSNALFFCFSKYYVCARVYRQVSADLILDGVAVEAKRPVPTNDILSKYKYLNSDKHVIIGN